MKYEQFDAGMRECFDKLPKFVQESIIQSNLEVDSLEQLENLAASLTNQTTKG